MSDSSKSALSLISMHRGYSESEQRIVDYILEHQSEAPRLTAAQLSRAAATSEATVSRFCRKLGFGSFRSFQFSLARASWKASAMKASPTRSRSTIWSRASRTSSLPR